VEGVQDRRCLPDVDLVQTFVDADLDTLATALYVRTDDLLKAAPERAPWRPAVGIAPKLSDAELVTLAVMQALLGLTSGRVRSFHQVRESLPTRDRSTLLPNSIAWSITGSHHRGALASFCLPTKAVRPTGRRRRCGRPLHLEGGRRPRPVRPHGLAALHA
jgi:hypothetical protein